MAQYLRVKYPGIPLDSFGILLPTDADYTPEERNSQLLGCEKFRSLNDRYYGR